MSIDDRESERRGRDDLFFYLKYYTLSILLVVYKTYSSMQMPTFPD